MSKGFLKRLREKTLVRLYLGFPLLFLLLSFLMFLDPNLGKYLWLQHQKESVKQKVAEKINRGLEQEKLVLFKLGFEEVKTKLRWLSSHEFELNDELYDVVEAAVDEGAVFLWCWADREETRLRREIDRVISQSLGKEKEAWAKQDEVSSVSRYWPLLPRPWLRPGKPQLVAFIYWLLCPDYFYLSLQPPKPPPRLLEVLPPFAA